MGLWLLLFFLNVRPVDYLRESNHKEEKAAEHIFEVDVQEIGVEGVVLCVVLFLQFAIPDVWSNQ